MLRGVGLVALGLGVTRLPDWLGGASPVQATQTGVAGRATDIITGRPVARAGITAIPGDYQTQTDGDGRYQLALPPGRYEIRIVAKGYIGMSHIRQEVSIGQVRPVDFALIPEGLTASEQQAVQGRVLPGATEPLAGC